MNESEIKAAASEWWLKLTPEQQRDYARFVKTYFRKGERNV